MANINLKEVDTTNIEGNSNKKKVTPVIKSGVTTQKPSVGKRVKNALTDSDGQSVGSYILYDVTIPAVKTFITDAVSTGINMLLWGDRGVPNNVHRQGGRSYTAYNRATPSYTSVRGGQQPRQQSYSKPRSRGMLDDLVFETRTDAEIVLSSLDTLIRDYGSASALDLYDLIGRSADHAANNFGWTHLQGAAVQVNRGGGFILVLPETEML